MTVASPRISKKICFHLLTVTTLFLIVGHDMASAQARAHCNDKLVCSEASQNAVKSSRHRSRVSSSRSEFATVRLDANGNGTIIGGRPAGCPHNYCGCGLRMYLGLADKRFNLAWNWARYFP